MAKKQYHRYIRINGKMKKSPKGLSKVQADLWYQEKYKQKVAMNAGVYFAAGSGPTLNDYFNNTWFPRRRQGLKSTWLSDEQRYRDYVEQEIGFYKISQINTIQVRNCLRKIVDERRLSPATRNRVQALLSKIFKDAFNEEMPLVNTNPVSGVRFDDPRTGSKSPPHLKKQSEIHKFLKGAKDLSLKHLTLAMLGLGAGLRKQEIIPLRWCDWDQENHMIDVSRRFIQASGEIVAGTKSGTDEMRSIPISDEVEAVLREHKKQSRFSKSNDYILSTRTGGHMAPRTLATYQEDICKKSGVKINPHGLRHTFGRLFAKSSGNNLKALQTILGHSTIAVTEIYSTLSGEQVKGTRNVVKLEGEND